METILKFFKDIEKKITLVLCEEDSVYYVNFTEIIDGYYYPKFFEFFKYSYALKKFNDLMLELLDSAEKLHEEDDILIANLDLSPRARNCLLRANIETLDELTECSLPMLRRIRNLGNKCLEEIIEVAKEHGVELHE